MNNRDYKQFAPNTIRHIFNRGNGKMDIYRCEDDYLLQIKIMKVALGLTKIPFVSGPRQRESLSRMQPLPKDAFTVLAYCLMPNHYHFIIQQNGAIPISKLIAKIETSYGKSFNKKYFHIGGVFQDAFKSVPVNSDEQLLWLSSYVHNNPRTAGLVENLTEWPYSSFPEYAGSRDGVLADPKFILEMIGGQAAYKKFTDDSFAKIKERKDLEHLLLD